MLASLLEMNPGVKVKVKGVFCSSWWYDPQLEAISPRLKYLSAVPTDNGAQLFFMKPTKVRPTGQ
jgi:hypothetical protein